MHANQGDWDKKYLEKFLKKSVNFDPEHKRWIEKAGSPKKLIDPLIAALIEYCNNRVPRGELPNLGEVIKNQAAKIKELEKEKRRLEKEIDRLNSLTSSTPKTIDVQVVE